jgi:alkanesulfonate monooxygenase SsuD/methylene tetrahydromethanopterin reductase-like flavin-dependent oxidoreductase (luciferase family)
MAVVVLQNGHEGFESTDGFVALGFGSAMLGVSVVCADSDEQADWLAGPSALAFLSLRRGKPIPLPSPRTAAEYPYTDLDRRFIDERLASSFVGSPATVLDGLDRLLADTNADELMITTMVHDHADRRRSYELLAKLGR